MFKRKKDKMTKGTSQAVVLSILIHVGLFLLAGTLVVFTVVKKQEQEFEAPKAIERPKMKLKKPKVKVKKSSKPKTAKITSRSTRAVMPSIDVPDLGGMGVGMDMVGGMEMMPDLSGTGDSLLGTTISSGNDMIGTFYDFNRKKDGTTFSRARQEVAAKINEFFTKGWDKGVFRDVYKSKNNLFSTAVPLSLTPSELAPEAFNEPESDPWLWLVHYEGKIVYPEDITFRFWSFADDIVAVRVGGEIVSLNCFDKWITEFNDATQHHWTSSAAENRQYPIGNRMAVVGDWVTLKANVAKDLEILIGENLGGLFGGMLLVEVKGVDYPTSPITQMPILPFFKTDEFTRDQIEQIYWILPEGEGTVAGGPIFNDFHDPAAVSTEEPPDVIYPPEIVEIGADAETNAPPGLRERSTWQLADGKVVEGEFQTLLGSKVILTGERGKQQKIDLNAFAEEEKRVIAMAHPPQFDLNFTKSSSQVPQGPSSIINDEPRVWAWMYTFGIKVKQTTTTPYYNYPLTFEYFAIGKEAEGSNFILLDRKSETFDPPAAGKKQDYTIKGDEPIRVRQFMTYGGRRGSKYDGYLIIVRDVDGNIIQHIGKLIDVVDNLVHVPVGKHFNADGNRCMPPRPRKDDVPSWRTDR